MIEAMMPNIDRVGQKSLGKTHGREIDKDIEAIFTLTGKKNCLGYEICRTCVAS
jgi:hypothetical protein